MDQDLIPDGYTPEDAAAVFVRRYALEHEFFNSEAVLDAYKKAGLPIPPDKGWRDKWGGVMIRAAKSGYIVKAGKSAPSSGSTHMSSTVLWQSRIFEGERTMVETGKDYLEQLRTAWVLRSVTDLRELLWKAYEFGYSQGAADKAKLPKK